MKHLNIHCTYDEIRMIDLNEHIDGRHNHSVYSMFNDDYEYVNAK